MLDEIACQRYCIPHLKRVDGLFHVAVFPQLERAGQSRRIAHQLAKESISFQRFRVLPLAGANLIPESKKIFLASAVRVSVALGTAIRRLSVSVYPSDTATGISDSSVYSRTGSGQAIRKRAIYPFPAIRFSSSSSSAT